MTDPTPAPRSAVEQLTAVLDVEQQEHFARIEVRRQRGSFSDLRLFFDDQRWMNSHAGRRLVSTLDAVPCVGSVRCQGASLAVRLRDEFITHLGEQLIAGEGSGLAAADLLAGQQYVVGFVGPNVSKALHVGHLRNIALGHGYASALAAGGARVLRQSLVGDIGRNVCEAMAGYLESHTGKDPRESGIKSDHFVGRCYTDFVRRHDTADAGGADPVRRELSTHDDRADDLMMRWLAGDPDVRALWRTLCDWVTAGHDATLRRLGVRFDRVDLESGAMHDAQAMVARGVASGLFERRDDGRVVYRTGRPEFDAMVLARVDGFPTEHARLIAVYQRMLAEPGPPFIYLDLAGIEWQMASAVHMEIIDRMRRETSPHRHVQRFHEMVIADHGKLSSSQTGALLIDDLLDHLEAAAPVRQMSDSTGGRVDCRSIVDIIVKVPILVRPAMRPMLFDESTALASTNAAWTVARGVCAAWDGMPHAGNDDRDWFRLVVLRSQEFRRLLSHTARTLILTDLAGYLLRFSELLPSSGPRARRVGRAVLEPLLASLGISTGDQPAS